MCDRSLPLATWHSSTIVSVNRYMSLILAFISFFVFELVYYRFLLPLIGPSPGGHFVFAGIFLGVPVAMVTHGIVWRLLGIPEKALNNPPAFYSDMPRDRVVNAIYAVLSQALVHGEKFYYINCDESKGELSAETNLAQSAFFYPFAGSLLRVMSDLLDTISFREHSYVEVRFEIKVKVTGIDSANSKVQVIFVNRARPAIFNPWGARERSRFLKEFKTAVRARAKISGRGLPSLPPADESIPSFDSVELYQIRGADSLTSYDGESLPSCNADDSNSAEALPGKLEPVVKEEDVRRKEPRGKGKLDAADNMQFAEPSSDASGGRSATGASPIVKIYKGTGGRKDSAKNREDHSYVKRDFAIAREQCSIAKSDSRIVRPEFDVAIDWQQQRRNIQEREGTEVIERICQDAARKDKVALVQLGELIFEGLNGQPDYKQALKLFEVASRENYPPAFLALSRMYLLGYGTNVDEVKSLELLQRATAGGFPPALYELGMRYCAGDGVLVDTFAGSQYLLTAASKGHAGAQLELALLMLTNAPCHRDHREVTHWLAQAAGNGQVVAYYFLGIYYLGAYGHLLEPDYVAAAKAFDRGTKAGDPLAAYELGLLYLEGLGVNQNLAEGRRLIKQAASAGVEDAREKLREL